MNLAVLCDFVLFSACVLCWTMLPVITWTLCFGCGCQFAIPDDDSISLLKIHGVILDLDKVFCELEDALEWCEEQVLFRCVTVCFREVTVTFTVSVLWLLVCFLFNTWRMSITWALFTCVCWWTIWTHMCCSCRHITARSAVKSYQSEETNYAFSPRPSKKKRELVEQTPSKWLHQWLLTKSLSHGN